MTLRVFLVKRSKSSSSSPFTLMRSLFKAAAPSRFEGPMSSSPPSRMRRGPSRLLSLADGSQSQRVRPLVGFPFTFFVASPPVQSSSSRAPERRLRDQHKKTGNPMDVIGETKQFTGSIGNVASKSAKGPAASLSSMGQTEGGVGAARLTHNAVRSIPHGRRVSTKGTHGKSTRRSVDDSAEPPFKRPSLARAIPSSTLPANN